MEGGEVEGEEEGEAEGGEVEGGRKNFGYVWSTVCFQPRHIISLTPFSLYLDFLPFSLNWETTEIENYLNFYSPIRFRDLCFFNISLNTQTRHFHILSLANFQAIKVV